MAQAAPTVGGGESDGDATKALPERATSARPEPLPARLRRVCEVLGLEPGRNLVATARSAAEALGLGLSGKSLPVRPGIGARAMSELEDEVMFFKLTDTEKKEICHG